MKRIDPLTAIRGIFALYVAIYHIFPRNSNFVANGYLSVDLFFILSGFIMSYTYQKKFISGVLMHDYANYIKGRLARVYPLYLSIIILTSIAYISNSMALPNIKEYSSLLLFFQSLYYVENNLVPHAWSIAVEVLAYLIFPFLIHRLFGRKISASIIPVIYISFAGLALVSMHGYWGAMDVTTGALAIVRCFCEYLLGIAGYILLKNYRYKLTGLNVEILLISACALAFTALNMKGYDLVAIIAFAFVIPMLSESKGVISVFLSTKIMVYLGEISYSIYLVHYPLCRKLIFIPTWIQNKTGAPDINYIVLIMTILTAIITYHFIEIPCRHLIKSMKIK